MSVVIEAQLARPGFSLDARLQAGPGLTALFGRSGSGKTTLVNIVAGLVRPDRGRVAVGGRVLLDTERGLDLPPHGRDVGYVFQEGRLFPHLSVRANLLYGAWFRGGRDRAAELDRIVALLGIGHLLQRRPAGLSGGEQQRVAIGRALLARPRVLLMDEPLASLDAPRRAEILPFLERLRDDAGIPILYVSHSLAEVTRLATTLVVVDAGRIAAAGLVTEVLGRPDLWPLTGQREAGIVLTGSVVAGDDGDGLVRIATAAGTLVVPARGLATGPTVRLHVHARDVLVATEEPRGLSARNILPARVAAVPGGEGAEVDVELDAGGERLVARVTRRAVRELGLVPGRAVYAVLKAAALDGGEPAEV